MRRTVTRDLSADVSNKINLIAILLSFALYWFIKFVSKLLKKNIVQKFSFCED